MEFSRSLPPNWRPDGSAMGSPPVEVSQPARSRESGQALRQQIGRRTLTYNGGASVVSGMPRTRVPQIDTRLSHSPQSQHQGSWLCASTGYLNVDRPATPPPRPGRSGFQMSIVLRSHPRLVPTTASGRGSLYRPKVSGLTPIRSATSARDR
jgi:hypothetical protein